MRSSKIQWLIAILLAGSAVGALAQGAPAPTPVAALRISVAGAPRQGGMLLVRAAGAQYTDGTCYWQGGHYPMAGVSGSIETAVPVKVNARTGDNVVRVQCGYQTAQQMVDVAPTWFPRQSIWLPAAVLAWYDSPRARRDDERLLAACRRFDPHRWWRGDFRPPVRGRQTTAFGVRRTYNGWKHGIHHGIDVAVGPGTAVRAPNDGVVAIVAPHLLVDGSALVVDHGLGVCTMFMHLSRYAVRPGDHVRKGQVLAWTGESGAGTGPHLHWGAYVQGVSVDPHVLFHLPAEWR